MTEGEIIRGYIIENLLDGDRPPTIEDEGDLLGQGLLDSLGVLRLVVFLEEHFDISIPEEDVTIENFRTVSSIVGYLVRQQVGR